MASAAGATGLRSRFDAAWPRFRRPLRDALVLVGLLRAVVFFFVQGEQPWTFWGVDARAYWGIDLAHPYANSGVGDVSTYLYSPAFAQLLSPFSALPFEVFFVLWTAVSVAILVWLVRPWPWAVPMLILPIVYELFVGNIHFLLAFAFVVAVRYPVAWVVPVLTKVTPGVGWLWHVVRREWRSAVVAAGVTLGIVGVSYLLNPSAWTDWLSLLTSSPSRSDLLLPRVVLAALLVLWGARGGKGWVVPVAGWLALPVIWVNSWVILLAVIRLRDPRPAGTLLR